MLNKLKRFLELNGKVDTNDATDEERSEWCDGILQAPVLVKKLIEAVELARKNQWKGRKSIYIRGEWMGIESCCPDCEALEEEGHKPDCETAKFLSEFEEVETKGKEPTHENS